MEKELKDILLSSGLPKIYLDAEIAKIDRKLYEDELSEVYDYMSNQENTFFKGNGLAFFGDTGVGKSYFMAAMFKWLCENKKSCRYYPMNKLVGLSETTGQIETGTTFSQIFNQIDALFIDDMNFSVHQVKRGNSRIEWELAQMEDTLFVQKTITLLRQIITTMKHRGKPIFIATQLNSGKKESFRGAFTDITVNLINSICTPIEFGTKEYMKIYER